MAEAARIQEGSSPTVSPRPLSYGTDRERSSSIRRSIDAVALILRARGMNVLHNHALPFPLTGSRAQFVLCMREALKDG